ncbi:signal recognition particle receptor subunit alpha [Candidatus Woesearchaeota archaeon]|nr:signal recognition particle receptor subunit alpha [Candidatus Woesearchaeota archaeon]
MVLDNLGEKLKEGLRKIARGMTIDENAINSLVKDIQRALLQADVDVSLVLDITKRIKERAMKEKDIKGLDLRGRIVNIVYEELVKFLGNEKSEIKINKNKPFKIMMVGVYGAGKTTTIGKLAKFYHKRGYKVAAVGLDVHRPAAPDQLKQVCDSIKIPVYIDKNEKNALKIYEKYEKEFTKYDILIVDTAGRHDLDEDLIEEIKNLDRKIKPDEKILVMAADIGQAAYKLAKGFHEACGVTSIIITKLDGTARGGGALSGAAASGANVKFIGVGEKVDDLEQFNPKGFVGRVLGMGDIESLLEKAKEAIDEEKAEDISKRLLEGDFNLVDLYEQMEAMNKMGSLSKIMEMVPGMGQIKLPKETLKVQEGKLGKWREAMNSMTKSELENPDIIEGNRIQRIAKGSGVSGSDIRELIKQYRMSKKMMKMMKGQDPEKLMKKLQGKIGKGM